MAAMVSLRIRHSASGRFSRGARFASPIGLALSSPANSGIGFKPRKLIGNRPRDTVCEPFPAHLEGKKDIPNGLGNCYSFRPRTFFDRLTGD